MVTLQGISETTETDVTGNCMVKYEVSSSYGSYKLKKTKNMNSCTDRTSAKTIFQTVGYDSDSAVQSVPLMTSTQQCEQEINGRSKILSRSECTELHVFSPFSNDRSGATTEITNKLTFSRQVEGTQRATNPMRSRQSLRYDHTLTDSEIAATLRDVQQTVTSLCRQTETDVRPEAPRLFASLVKQMRRLDARTLQQLIADKSRYCAKAGSFFNDALPVLQTAAAVSVIRDVISRGQVTPKQKDTLMTSLAFIKNPTTDMMKELGTLLRTDFESAALPVSSVVNTYCRLNEQESPEVTNIIKSFETELRYNCRVENDAQRDKILLTLRAIGNAGNAQQLVATLNRCVNNEDAQMSIRVAAINAYRRISCDASREELLKVFENRQSDSELRINAYLMTMQCANQKIIDRVRAMLQTEEVNQVGSFIWTHLTNLAETSSPMKEEISALIEDPDLLREFDLDKRKFSRNIELSSFNELLNVGASLESNLIWSSASYVPRSASVNLTMDVFGQSMNLVEVGGRAEGLESILERYFGPESDIQKQMKREKRAVIRDDVISNIDRQFPKTRDPTQLSYYMRVFGNEIRAGDVYNIDVEELKNKFKFDDLLASLAQDRSVDFTRSFAFLDTSVVTPTGVGMPLRLGAEGTATIALTATGKVDLRKIFAGASDFDITGSVRPSAAVEVQGEFGVEAGSKARTRVTVRNTMHTSTVMDGKLTLKNGQVFNAEWNMPQQKIEVFSAESHFYVSYRGQDREQNNVQRNAVSKKRCTDPTVARKLGLELCGELSYPGVAPNGRLYLTSGPTVAKIYINKLDTFTGAKFEASFISAKDTGICTARLAFNTPGSTVDREVTVDFRLDKPNKDLTFNLKSPWKKISVTGQAVYQPQQLMRSTLRAVVDDKQEYSVNAEMTIAELRTGEMKYTPSVRVVIPDREPITVDGEMQYLKNRKLSGKIEIKNAFRTPVTAEGTIELQDRKKTQKYDVNVQFSAPVVRGSVAGFVSSIQDTSGQAWVSRADVNYQYQNGAKQRVVVNHKLRDMSTDNLKSYSMEGSWTTTMWPRYNGNFAVEKQFSRTSLRMRLEAGFDATRKITIIQSGAFDVSGNDKKVNAMLKFELPIKNWNYEAKLEHVHNSAMLQTNASVKYEQNKEATLDVGVRRESTRQMNAVAEGTLRLPGYPPMTLRDTLVERQQGEYQNDLNVAGMGKQLRASTTYKMGQRHEMTTNIQATGQPPISIKGHLNPNALNMQARAEVKYGPQEYIADVSWLHRGTGSSFNTRAGLEVQCPQFRYSASGDVSRRNQDFTGSVEMKNQMNDQRILVTGQVTASTTAPKAEARVEWPGSFVALSSTGKYNTQDWRSNENDLEAAVKVMTSYRGFEEMGGSARFDVGPDSMKSSGEVKWAPDRKMTGSFYYDTTKASANVTTPFEGYRILKGEGTYMLRGRTLKTSLNVQWDASQIAGNIEGTANLPAFNARATFTSPIRNLESLSASIQNTVNGNQYQTTAEVSWARNQKINLVASMTHQQGRGMALSNTGEATVTTPWRRYRTSKLSWRHENDNGSQWKCHHELEFDSQKYILDIDGTASRSGNTFKSQGKGSVSWGSNTISAEHDLNLQLRQSLVAKAKVMTPFQGYEVLGVELDNKLQPNNNGFTSTNVITLGQDARSKVTIEGSLTYQGPQFNAALRMTTPSPNFPRMVVNARNARQSDGSWAAHGDLEYAPDKTFTVDGKLTMDRTYGLELSMTSPYQNMRSMSAKASAVVRSPRSFTTAAELIHNKLRGPIKFDSAVEVETAQSARISASLSTPFQQLSVAKLSASHVYETKERCQTTASYELNEYRGQFSHRQTVRSSTSFDGTTRLEYVTGKTLGLEHSVLINPSTRRNTITASLTTPFNDAREVSLNINTNGPVNNMKVDTEILINRRDKITATGELMMDEENGVTKQSIRITTPYTALRRFVATIDSKQPTTREYRDLAQGYSNKKLEWKEERTYELNDNRWYYSLDSTYFNKDFKYNAKIETPYEWARTAELNVEHLIKSGRDGNGWVDTGSLQVNDARYTAESEYLWIGPQMRASAKVGLPNKGIQNVTEYSFRLLHQTSPNNDVTTTLAAKAGAHFTGLATFNMQSNAQLIEARVTAETPYRGYEKFELNLKHEGPVSNFRTTASLATPFRDYRSFATELTYRGNPYDFVSSLQVDTPFRSMPRLTAALNHKMSGDWRRSGQLDTGLSFDYSGKRIGTTLSYKLDARTVQLTSSLSTPYEGMESFAIDVTHTQQAPGSFKTTGKLTTSRPNLREVTGSLEVTSPSGTELRIRGEVVLPSSGRIMSTYSHSSRQAGELQGSLEVTTPYRGYERTALTYNHAGSRRGVRASGSVETSVRGYERIAFTMNHAGDANQFETSGTITTPFREAPQIDYTIMYRGTSIKDFKTGVILAYSGKKIEVETGFSMTNPNSQEMNYEGSLKITSPCPYIRDLLASGSHNRKAAVKSGTLAVTLNGEKKVDMDYNYATVGPRNININFRDPYPMATNIAVKDSTGSAEVNWDTSDVSKKVRFDFSFKNVETATTTERSISFKTTIPQRVIGFGFGYTTSPDRFTNRAELLWNADSRPDFVYDIQASRSLRKALQTYDGSFKITSAIINFDSTLSHRSQPGRKYTTEIGLQTIEKLTIKNDITFTSDTDFTHTLTAQHPKFGRDASLVTSVTGGNSFTSALNYEQQSMTLDGRLADESRPGNAKYSGFLRFKHPNSLTDVQVGGEAYSDSVKCGGNLKSSYQTTRDRQMQNAELRAEINRLRKEINVEMSSPLDVIKLSAVNRDMTNQPGVCRYDVIVSNKQTTYKLTSDMSANDRSVNMQLYSNNDDYIQLFAQIFSPTQATFELSRMTRGQKVSDARAALSMSDDRVLKGSAYVRPDLKRDVMAYMNQMSTDQTMPRYFSSNVDRVRRAVQDEMYLKSSYVHQAVDPLVNAGLYISAELSSKMDQLSTAFHNAYRRNEFYMRDIHQTLQRHYDDWNRRMQYKMADMKREYERTSRIAGQKWNEFCDWVSETCRKVNEAVNQRTAALMKYTEANMRPVKQWFDEVNYKLSRVELSDIAESASRSMQRVRAYIERIIAQIDATLENFYNKPEVMRAREYVLRTLEDNKWLYQYFGLEQKVTEFIQRARAMTYPMIRAQIKQAFENKFQLSRNRWTVWNPQRGEYEFEVYVPFEVPDVPTLRRMSVPLTVLSNLRETIASALPSDDFNLVDTINAYKPTSDVADWVPPFKAHATLTGPQHYVTFDRKFYDFAGDSCSYLLARDFVDKTFSVIVNYDKSTRGQPVKKSLQLIADGKQIEIFPDGKVSVDGRRTELPVQVESMTVSRLGNTISVNNERGLQIVCDLPHDHCTVSVSGWYYGKTAGLFGTYDNEQVNDFTSLDKRLVDKPETLADSWTVGARCRAVNLAPATPALDENTRRFKACAKYFRDVTSPFRPCFRRVDPDLYLDMCMSDVPRDDNSLQGQEDVCRVAAAYVSECNLQEVTVRMPSQCVSCEVPFTSDKFYEGESKELSGAAVPMTADVVFVIQHAACNKDLLPKIRDFVTSMDNALKAEGVKGTQYAVVGYGGKGYLAEPRVHTMDGQLFNTAQKIPLALNGFDIETGSKSDAMAAIRFVARLPFRSGASKTVILVPCDACHENTARYSEIQRILLQGDIHLHMLIQEMVKLKSKSPKTAYIFGVDESTVYTSKDVAASNDLAGEPDLRKYIRLPKDLCVALTQDAEGSVFSARQWIDSRPPIQKKFSDVLVRAVARKAKPTTCQVCECVADKHGSAVSQCRSCSPRSALYSLMPNFYGDDFNDEEEMVPGAAVKPVVARPTVRPPGKGPAVRKPPRVPVPKNTPAPKRVAPVVVPQVKQE